jgi:hypothetical protein
VLNLSVFIKDGVHPDCSIHPALSLHAGKPVSLRDLDARFDIAADFKAWGLGRHGRLG